MYSQVGPQIQRPALIPRNPTSLAPPDAVRFKITMPHGSDLRLAFLMHLDEINETLPPGIHPLKFGVFGTFKYLQDRHHQTEKTFKIRFYELCPATEREKDCFASVEWRVLEDPGTGELKFWNGMISFPLCGLDNTKNSIDLFMRKAGYKTRTSHLASPPNPTLTRQVLVDNHRTYHSLENVVHAHANGTDSRYLSARHIYPGPVDYYSLLVDLRKERYESREYDGRVEMYNIPRPSGLKCRDSQILRPMIVWLLLSALERDQEAFSIYVGGEAARS
ncbi:hypothetical protein GALMADRAFT_1356310 [Galerina marginata CBS 339.88]|uniref:Uncharacterized protein n=1 Tax=Galerina marginata (strain CBS 339.88) TaxID=685588 RepID=A0A067S921_GALM3|nr:hypothetical protein GALMADRAFT_1356310 [Galerina marginata CBS 339.88]